MRNSFRAGLLASALALSAIPLAVSTAPAEARVNFSVGFNSFYDQLSDYGDWVYSDRWGEVWVPNNVPRNFRPYGTRGHWANTRNYGWVWVSNYPWGDITFHYGRWVNDRYDGWMWIPGYVWSPGWVVWRSSGRYTGWMAMPPDDDFLRGGFSIGFGSSGLWASFNNYDDYYGYSRWYGRDYGRDRFASNWVFVDTGHLGASDYSRYAVNNSRQVSTIIQNSNNITNYTVVNNYVVNRSIDTKAVERASGRPVAVVEPRAIFKNPDVITRADTGRQIQSQMRMTAPRGTGEANSAPRPSEDVIKTLSTRSIERNGGTPAHLFTRQTIDKAPLAVGPASKALPATTETPADRALKAREDRTPSNTMAPGAGGAPAGGETPADRAARLRDMRKNTGPETTGPTGPAAPTGPAEQQTVPEKKTINRARGGNDMMGPTGPTGPGASGETPTGTPRTLGNKPSDTAPVEPRMHRVEPVTNAPAGGAQPATTETPKTLPEERIKRGRPDHTPEGAGGPASTTAPATAAPTATTPAGTTTPADDNKGKHKRKKPGEPDSTDTPQ